MKTFLIAIMALSLASCEKKRCYQCTVTVTYTPTGYGLGGATANTSMCDVTEDQMREYERMGTKTTTASSGGVTVTEKITTVCR